MEQVGEEYEDGSLFKMLKFFTVALIFVVIIISLIWAFVLLKLPDKESKKKEKSKSRLAAHVKNFV